MHDVLRAKFSLKLLGRFELTGPDGPVELPNKKLVGLLAYLVCTAPTPQPRDRLATLLWGSHFELQAKQNLRQALHRLRQVIGPDALATDHESILLDGSVVNCDATRIRTLSEKGDEASLAEIATLYNDRLLSDVNIPEEAWAEWLGVERQRLESMALDAMIKHAGQELHSGNAKQAYSIACKAIDLNNLREDAHRLVIQALASVGRRADALKHYEDLKMLLNRELAVEPDPVTRSLAAELRRPSAAPSGPNGEAGRPSTPEVVPEATAVLPPLPDQPSLAVLPFANMSDDPKQEYFADGVVEDILSALSRVRWLFVIARQSSFIYKVRSVDVRQIGRELGVRYVVEGSVRKSGNRVRIVAQLIETETGAHLWADRYESDLRDIFDLQDEITERIVSAVEMNVQTAEIKRTRRKPTNSMTAYDLYLQALPAYYGQTEVDYKRAGLLFGRALEADGEYSEAIGLLTDSVAVRTLQGWHQSWSEGVDDACRLAGRAVNAGPENSTCLASAAFTYGILSHRFDEAFDLADRALALHPNSILVRNRAGAVYAVCGEFDKAIAQCEAAGRMNPLASKKAATSTYTTLSCALYFAGRFEDCIETGRRALALVPHETISRKYVAMSLAQLGHLHEAQLEIAELVKRQSDASIALFGQQGFRHKWMHEFHLEGLRKAGLKEN